MPEPDPHLDGAALAGPNPPPLLRELYAGAVVVDGTVPSEPEFGQEDTRRLAALLRVPLLPEDVTAVTAALCEHYAAYAKFDDLDLDKIDPGVIHPVEWVDRSRER